MFICKTDEGFRTEGITTYIYPAYQTSAYSDIQLA